MIDKSKKLNLNQEENKDKEDLNAFFASKKAKSVNSSDIYMKKALNLTELHEMMNLSREESIQKNMEKAEQLKVEMPITFPDKLSYCTKLKELLETEAMVY